MPSIRQLQYLVALAETRHFRKASEQCNTTQPTLSEQIKSLEDRLGAQLVERSRAGVLITPIGLQVVEIARRILRDVSEIRSFAAGGDETLRGVLRLSVPSTIGPYLLPHVVPETRAELNGRVRGEPTGRQGEDAEAGKARQHAAREVLAHLIHADLAGFPLGVLPGCRHGGQVIVAVHARRLIEARRPVLVGDHQQRVQGERG